jgi:hypothetical protein
MRKIKVPFNLREVSDELVVEPGYHLGEVMRILPKHLEDDGTNTDISPGDEETQVDKIVIVTKVKEGSSINLSVHDWINLTDGHPDPRDNVGLRDKQRLKSFFEATGLEGNELDIAEAVGKDVCIEVFHRGTGAFKAKVRKYFPPEEYRTIAEAEEEPLEEEPEVKAEIATEEKKTVKEETEEEEVQF